MLSNIAIRILVSIILLTTTSTFVLAIDSGCETKTVRYFSDSVIEIEKVNIKLLGGSVWMLSMEPVTLLPMTNVFVLITDTDNGQIGIFYTTFNVYYGLLIKGYPSTQTGTLTWVTNEMGDGAILKTCDGKLWGISSYDRYDTGYWLPPYQVLITSDQMYMYNLEKNKKIWVTLEK